MPLDFDTMSGFIIQPSTTRGRAFAAGPLHERTAMQYTFQVQGMTCGHCERAVVHAVREVDTDATVKVDLATGQVVVESDHPREALANAIREEGYQVAA